MEYVGTSKTSYDSFLTLEEEFREVHADKYDYNKVEFFNARTPIIITCPEHGDFAQRARDHKRGQGCRKCFLANNAKNRTKPIAKVVEELDKIDRFSYPELSSLEDIKAHDRVLTKCVECGNEKYHKLHAILSGNAGCKPCNNNTKKWTAERYENKETILYFIRINGLYKVGLTRKSVASRYYKELQEGYDIEVIFTVKYNNGAEAFKEEQRVLKEYSDFRYRGEKMLINGGDSELFTINIFNNTGGVPSTL